MTSRRHHIYCEDTESDGLDLILIRSCHVLSFSLLTLIISYSLLLTHIILFIPVGILKPLTFCCSKSAT